MDEKTETNVIPRVILADDYADYRAPQVTVSSDAGGVRFGKSATLTVPKLLYLLEHPGGEGAFTHLAVDVWSTFFAKYHDWKYEVTVALDGKPLDKRLFHKWYGRHQFLMPLTSFRRDRHQITLTAMPTEVGASTDEEVCFDTAPSLISKPGLWSEFEKRAIWVFSDGAIGQYLARFRPALFIQRSAPA